MQKTKLLVLRLSSYREAIRTILKVIRCHARCIISNGNLVPNRIDVCTSDAHLVRVLVAEDFLNFWVKSE